MEAAENMAVKLGREEKGLRNLSKDEVIDYIFNQPDLEDGFITTTGKFISREEADNQARAEGREPESHGGYTQNLPGYPELLPPRDE